MTNHEPKSLEEVLAKRSPELIKFQKSIQLLRLRELLVEIENEPTHEFIDKFERLSKRFVQEERRQLEPRSEDKTDD